MHCLDRPACVISAPVLSCPSKVWFPCGKSCFRSGSVTLSDLLKVIFPFIQLVNLEDTITVKCTVYSSISTIASGGRTSIIDHLQAKEHRYRLLNLSRGAWQTIFVNWSLQKQNTTWLVMKLRMPIILYSTIMFYAVRIVQQLYRLNMQTINFTVQEQSANK
jgi:hypothetical protein